MVMNLKLFKKDKWLRCLFEIEIILIVSILISIAVTLIVGGNNTSPVTISRDYSGLFEKYRIFSHILDIKPAELTLKDAENLKEGFVKDFLTIRSLKTDLKEKSYGIIDDYIRDFKTDDPFLEQEITKLRLKNFFIKKKYSDYIKEYKKHDIGNEFDLFLLKSHIMLKDEQNSLDVFKDLFLSGPSGKFRDYLTPSEITDLLNRVDQGFWNTKLEQMMDTGDYSDFGEIRRYIRDRQLSDYVSAEIAYAGGKYSTARSLLTKIRSARFIAGKEKLLLKIRIREDDYSDIDPALEKLMSEKEVYRRLLLDIASIFLIKGESERSDEYFTRYISEIKGSGETPEESYWRALWVNAWLKVRSGNNETATELFKEGKGSPVLSYRIANSFWHSMMNGLNDPEIEKYPFTYYYARYSSLKGSGKKPDISNFTRLFNKKGAPIFHETARIIIDLLKFGLYEEALEYISWAKGSSLYSPRDLNAVRLIETLVYLKKNDHYFIFSSFVKNFRDYERLVLPNFLRDIYLPVRHIDLIELYCEEAAVDKHLVLALMNRESMFRKDVISPAKAKGLMQIIDGTAASTARKIGIKLGRNEIYNPEINIRLGVAHLKELLDKYDGKIYLALAAYNAGSHRVKKWLDEFGHFDEEKFIEMIPFSETRNYVKIVLRNYYYYQYYYDPEEWNNIRI